MKRLFGPLTWAFAILIGGAFLLTPNGLVSIVTNPVPRIVLGVVICVSGLGAFFNQR